MISFKSQVFYFTINLGGNNLDFCFFSTHLKKIEAELAYNQKDFPKAISGLKKAIAIQDDLRYNEPPDWFFSVRDRLGGFLLLQKNYEETETVFCEDLEKHRRNERSLFGLRESLAGQNNKIGYYWVDQQFQDTWKYSPESLTLEEL